MDEGIVRRGGTYVIAMIAFSILFSLLVIVLNALTNPAALPTALGRTLLSIFLWWMLYKGHYWARLLYIILAGLGGVLGVVSGLGLISTTLLGAFILLTFGAGYLWVAGMLLFSASVNAFLTSGRREKSPEAT